MNIILVSRKLSHARSLNISRAQLALLALLFVAASAAASVGLFYIAARLAHVPALNHYLTAWMPATVETAAPLEGLDAVAVKLGQMEAELVRLDALSQRLAKAAGFKAAEFVEPPGRGGSLTNEQYPLTLEQVNELAKSLSRQLEERVDKLGLLESLVQEQSAKEELMPSAQPVKHGWYSSGFGWRVDPFTGRKAFHEGMDFSAAAGSAIYSAAGGIVRFSGFHPQYGNMVEVDHGNGLVTRYAHAQRRLARIGDVVMKGTKIAEVGSTGRSTGAHLHFEVLHKGAPQNPSRFLRPPS
jgi:murein DD-endopeptidase MepM/ murein hydrolase activator NlpD